MPQNRDARRSGIQENRLQVQAGLGGGRRKAQAEEALYSAPLMTKRVIANLKASSSRTSIKTSAA
jgi:hypothetical protein